MDHASEAARHRRLAEQFRAKADRMGDYEVKAYYRSIASSYDAIADSDDMLARDEPKFSN